ncbi:hypothetical protein TNCV_2749451 [Trichonephila clavipes]|nr:hypothetical protein TNCV_2749451 [Trichonephila clavipes]
MSGLGTKRDRGKGRKWGNLVERKELYPTGFKVQYINWKKTCVIGFLAVTEMTGEYLTNAIMGELEKNGLDQGWADFYMVRSTSMFVKVLRSTQWRRCGGHLKMSWRSIAIDLKPTPEVQNSRGKVYDNGANMLEKVRLFRGWYESKSFLWRYKLK